MPCTQRQFKIINNIPHLSQAKTWDCGITCLTMAVKYLKPELREDSVSEACQAYGLGESVWTIDLAYICSILGIKHRFCTETMGVDENYSKESFYVDEMKGTFSEEESRINGKFKNAAENGVVVQNATIDVEKILENISRNRPAIVLTNDRLLRPHLIKLEDVVKIKSNHQGILSSLLCCFCWRVIDSQEHEDTSEGNYWGHYVIIVGYDRKKRHFILHDPSPNGDFVTCDFTAFQKARTSYGTDGDILFLYPS